MSEDYDFEVLIDGKIKTNVLCSKCNKIIDNLDICRPCDCQKLYHSKCIVDLVENKITRCMFCYKQYKYSSELQFDFSHIFYIINLIVCLTLWLCISSIPWGINLKLDELCVRCFFIYENKIIYYPLIIILYLLFIVIDFITFWIFYVLLGNVKSRLMVSDISFIFIKVFLTWILAYPPLYFAPLNLLVKFIAIERIISMLYSSIKIVNVIYFNYEKITKIYKILIIMIISQIIIHGFGILCVYIYRMYIENTNSIESWLYPSLFSFSIGLVFSFILFVITFGVYKIFMVCLNIKVIIK